MKFFGHFGLIDVNYAKVPRARKLPVRCDKEWQRFVERPKNRWRLSSLTYTRARAGGERGSAQQQMQRCNLQ